MRSTTIWTTNKYVYRETNYGIRLMVGIPTISCQCYKDCTCSEDNRTGDDVTIYRVVGKSKRDWVKKPYNFKTLEEAHQRIKQLKL